MENVLNINIDSLIQMKCSRCDKKAETNLKHLGPLCKKDFCWIIEKRIRKNLRKNYDVKKNNKLLVFDDLTEYLIKKIIKTPVQLIKKSKTFFRIKEINDIFGNKKLNNFLKKNRIKYPVLPWTLDHETCFFIKDMFNNKKPKELKGCIKLLKYILEDEVIEFCKFRKIKYKRMKETREKKLLDSLGEKYSETKFSLLKSIEKLNKIKQ